MFQYDFCLSNLLHAWEDAAKVLREHEGEAPDELRLRGSVCLDCFDKDYTNTQLTDVDVDEISKRWWKLGILRGLYLDEAISRNFEKYKVQFVSNGPEYLGPDGIGPIIEESLELATQTTNSLEDAPDFKARFHQGLCLHSIALATRAHAIYSRHRIQMETDPPNVIGMKLFDRAHGLWKERHVVLNGRPIQRSHHAQFDCVEIYDFLYNFLLPEVVPFHALESWTAESTGRYPYTQVGGDLEDWACLLYNCRLTLQPSDIVDLVKHKTWRVESNFPADKTNYMHERGLFDLEAYGVADFHILFSRHSMIHEAPYSLCLIHEAPYSLCFEGDLLDDRKSCLWDEIRIKIGSPFRPRFWQMLDLEASKVDRTEADARDRSRYP